MSPLATTLVSVALVVVPALAEVHLPVPQDPLQRAQELKDSGDWDGAMAAFNEAVEASPGDLNTLIRRAFFFEQVAGIVVAKQREHFESLARADYAAIAAADPDTIIAGVARDGLIRLDGRVLFPVEEVECDEASMELYNKGQDHFYSGEYEEALAVFERWSETCPDFVSGWIAYADTHFVQGHYAQARKLFERALEAEPWSAMAHRFLADTLAREGDLEAAHHQAAWAIVSDPIYEAGWASLRNYTEVLGGTWHRSWAQRARVLPGEPGENGKPNFTIELPAQDDMPADVGAIWLAYGAELALELNAQRPGSDPAPVIERERRAVEVALAFADEGQCLEASPFWSMMARAEEAGYLDEAIFMHLMDETLADEYLDHRSEHGGRLVDYLTTVLSSTPGALLRKQQSLKAAHEIMTICLAVDSYALDNGGRYPESLEVLVVPDEEGHCYLEGLTAMPLDPWRNVYIYEYEPPPRGSYGRYRVVSYGKDGQAGGYGENADIDNFTIRER